MKELWSKQCPPFELLEKNHGNLADLIIFGIISAEELNLDT